MEFLVESAAYAMGLYIQWILFLLVIGGAFFAFKHFVLERKEREDERENERENKEKHETFIFNEAIVKKYRTHFEEINTKLSKEQLASILKMLPSTVTAYPREIEAGLALSTSERWNQKSVSKIMEQNWLEYIKNRDRSEVVYSTCVATLEQLNEIIKNANGEPEADKLGAWVNEIFAAKGASLSKSSNPDAGEEEDIMVICTLITLLEKNDHPKFRGYYITSKKNRDIFETFFRANLVRYSFSYRQCKEISKHALDRNMKALDLDLFKNIKQLNF